MAACKRKVELVAARRLSRRDRARRRWTGATYDIRLGSRVRSVKTAYSALRTLLPTRPADRKLSKVETLKLASRYINHLLAVLVVGDALDRPCSRLLRDEKARARDREDDADNDESSCDFCADYLQQDYNLNINSHVLPDFNNADMPTRPPAS